MGYHHILVQKYNNENINSTTILYAMYNLGDVITPVNSPFLFPANDSYVHAPSIAVQLHKLFFLLF